MGLQYIIFKRLQFWFQLIVFVYIPSTAFFFYHHADINVDNICGKFDSCDKDVTYVQNTKSFFS